MKTHLHTLTHWLGQKLSPYAALSTDAAAHEHAMHSAKVAPWLFAAFAPLIGLIGPIAYLQGHTATIWFVLPLLIFYAFIPLLDWWVGEDSRNPSEEHVAYLQSRSYFNGMVYLSSACVWLALIANLVFLAQHDLNWASTLALIITTGNVLGLGLNASHELGHKKDFFNRKLALFTAALGAYGHFSIEHNRGHHRHVATPEDPASSKLGETIYRFVLREIPGAMRRAWELESSRLELRGKSRWHYENEILQAHAFSLILYTTLVSAFGWRMLLILIPVILWGMFQLTSANYIEHYGLMRKKLDNGKYEVTQPHHSWNSNHLVSNLFLFQLQRHSDHHAHPTRHYQCLRDFPQLPRLPSGYFAMFVLAYLPPLWFKVMNPKVQAWAREHNSPINAL